MMKTMDYEAFCKFAEDVANDDYTILMWIDGQYFAGRLTQAQFFRYMAYATHLYAQGSAQWAPEAR